MKLYGKNFASTARVAFHDRPVESIGISLEESVENLHVDDALHFQRQHVVGRGKRGAKSQQKARPGRRQNCRADQFCVHVVEDGRQVPAYAVEFKAPH